MRVVAEVDTERESVASPETREMLTVMLETVHGPLLARSLQTAIQLGFFEALAGGGRTANEVALQCETNPRTTAALLEVLATTEYVSSTGDRYALTDLGRRWALGYRQGTVLSYFLMGVLEWRWYGHFATFLRTGEAVDMHAHLTPDEWRIYMDAMYVARKATAETIIPAIPVPEGACRLLDLGGGHGFQAIALCRLHPNLQAVVFDLPGAIDGSATWFDLESRGLEERISRQAGNALTDDFGDSEYDFILVDGVVHVLSEAHNQLLVQRCARALRPGGSLMLLDQLAQDHPGFDGQNNGFYHLLMTLICESGFWTLERMAQWQRTAGLEPTRSFRILGLTGAALARKPLAERPAE